MDIVSFISGYMRTAIIADFIDIGLVATLIYVVLKRIKDTSVFRLLRGVVVLLVVLLISTVFQLNTIMYILEYLTQIGAIALVIVFQPELRRILERMGKTNFYKSQGIEELTEGEIVINSIVNACERLSKDREGALIVFEKEDNIREVIASGVRVDAKVTTELIRNIFYPKAPLHDGAMIIKNGKIAAAACILPLSDNKSISKDLGTRHRAAVGMTENTDTLCVIVSEETGAISVASKGMLKRHLSPETLKKLLNYEFIKKETNKEKSGIHKFISKVYDIITLRDKMKEED